MAKKRKGRNQEQVGDYRHDEARRKNNPPAGIAPTYEVRVRETQAYAYDPHLDPQLQWAGKAEHTSFEVDVVSLHIHERISTRAILEAVKKPEPQLSLFGETPLPLDQQIEFYQHEVGWANRLILGDSLLVTNSLLVKEGMAGKVQMIYVDPPYGIKYASNFQPRTDRRDVKDKDEDLTHEPEQIKAYRDTWKLGTHSYLTYLCDRLLLARELLTESGSIFVQINDENLHLVRSLLDEVFRRENFVAVVAFAKTTGQAAKYLASVTDYLLWYARAKDQMKYRQLYSEKLPGQEGAKEYVNVELADGSVRTMTSAEIADPSLLPETARIFATDSIVSDGFSPDNSRDIEVREGGRAVVLSCGPNRHWKVGIEGTKLLWRAERLLPREGLRIFKRYLDEMPGSVMTNIWTDTRGETEKFYAVQTATKVIERCILMTTDPGDLIFDPTCGSGTTAYCAEKWGRRWITCDTSRVALAIARQRLMTARFDYYELLEPERGPAGGFDYEKVPHITLESIAKNTEIDAIAKKYQPQIDEVLAELNRALGKDWKEWEVPHDVGAHGGTPWPAKAQQAHERFWSLKRQKRQEIDASIQRNAPQETLYDRPQVKRGVVRVSGPFTVEAIPVPVVEDPTQVPIPQFEETVGADLVSAQQGRISDRGGDYLTTMLNLLKQQGGVLFPGGKRMELQNLRPINIGMLHAEAETKQNGKSLKVAVSFGPQYGPVTGTQTDEAIRVARRVGYDVLVLAGFSIEASAQALVQEAQVPGLSVHFANIAADALMQVEEAQGKVSLLKTTRASQIFTVFGQPDARVEKQKDGTCTVELRGVDIYDPLTGQTQHARGSDVAAWFLDTDYDGMTFHICQAFFPGDADAWDKLQRALKAQIDPEAFEQMRGTVSFPFQPGQHQRIVVKVIDFRGNEVVRVVSLNAVSYRRARE